jgi:hypothetical protein
MSGIEDDYDDYEDEFGGDARGSDNNVLRELRKQNRAKEKQIKELTERLTGLAQQARERSVKDVLAAKGLSPKIAKFIPEDMTSEEEVSAWVEENAEIFGGAPSQPLDDSGEAGPDLSGLTQISQIQATGQPFDGDSDQVAALIRSARSPEELNKVIFGTTSGPDAF